MLNFWLDVAPNAWGARSAWPSAKLRIYTGLNLDEAAINVIA